MKIHFSPADKRIVIFNLQQNFLTARPYVPGLSWNLQRVFTSLQNLGFCSEGLPYSLRHVKTYHKTMFFNSDSLGFVKSAIYL
jgi:hypothetical protein